MRGKPRVLQIIDSIQWVPSATLHRRKEEKKKGKKKHTRFQKWNTFIAEGAAYLLLDSGGHVVQIHQHGVLKMGASHPSTPTMMDK